MAALDLLLKRLGALPVERVGEFDMLGVLVDYSDPRFPEYPVVFLGAPRVSPMLVFFYLQNLISKYVDRDERFEDLVLERRDGRFPVARGWRIYVFNFKGVRLGVVVRG